MADDKFSEYTQGLYDTVIALRKEVDNLRTAYSIIHNRIDVMATLADKTTGDAVKEAIDIEELARLAVVAAGVAHKAAVVLIEAGAIEKAQKTLTATENTYTSAQASTVDSKARQTGGGALKNSK
jgi:coenzyme F420-reducing hydrogenase beta subunit